MNIAFTEGGRNLQDIYHIITGLGDACCALLGIVGIVTIIIIIIYIKRRKR
jgi:hypothetical protein